MAGHAHSQMKQLVIISSATPPQINGAAIMLDNVVRHLADAGWRVQLHVPDNSMIGEEPGVDVVRYPSFNSRFCPDFRYPRSIVPINGDGDSTNGATVIHVLTIGVFELFLLRKLRRRGTKTLVSILTDIPELAALVLGTPRFVSTAARTGCSVIERALVNMADGVHVLNRMRAASFVGRGKRVFLVHPGIDSSLLSHASKGPVASLAKGENGNKSVVFVGRLSNEKGIDRLIDLLEWDPAVTLFVVGDGPRKTHLVRAARDRRVSERLNLVGMLSQLELYKYVASMDLLVLPSKSEEFGLAALEALALGVPVLSCAGLRGPEELARYFPRDLSLVPSWDKESVLWAVRDHPARLGPGSPINEWTWKATVRKLARCYSVLEKMNS
jgi:glycosyltransferase involved in cell wall biosynthesis